MDNIVYITLKDPLNIKVKTDDYKYIKLLEEHFTYYVPNYIFLPQYKSGSWNGKSCLMRSDGSMPYGLLTELLRINKREFPRITTIIEPEVKNLFNGPKLKIIEDLKLKPYPYQKDCIKKALKYTKGIIRSATASGKSVIIAYIVKTLLENNKYKCLIIVPNKSLVEQFYNDMKEYGVKFSIGRVYQKYKEWNEDIVIATWQSMMRNHDKLSMYECVIVDECHGSSAYRLRQILVKASKAIYRLGFTGTLYASKLDNLNVYAYLGPIIAEYSSGELANKGYISKCTVNVVNLEYENEFKGTYDEVKDSIFINSYRLDVLKTIINKLDHNVLILVSKVEKEGDFLKEYLKNFLNKEIIFLSGRDDVKKREKWRKECIKRKDIALIATYQIFSQGINIPNLKYVIFASPLMSKIRVLQSIGRALRKHAEKKNGAIIYDIHDHTKYLTKHGNVRFRYYGMEGFSTNEIILNEGEATNNLTSILPK